MTSAMNDLKARLVIAAAAALGLSAGCGGDQEPAAAEPAPPSPATTRTDEPVTGADREEPVDDGAPETVALDDDEDAPRREPEAATPAPVDRGGRERRASPATGSRQGASSPDEATCGASCGADCSGVPGEEEDE